MMYPIVTLITAYSQNRVIGLDGKLPWHLPSDFKHFKETTLSQPIIMGRKTWESLPKRPLPRRMNIVISKDKDYVAPGAQVFTSLKIALNALRDFQHVFVIGGESIYIAALPYALNLIATEIHAIVRGNSYFPSLDSAWSEYARYPQPPENGLRYDFVCYYNADVQRAMTQELLEAAWPTLTKQGKRKASTGLGSKLKYEPSPPTVGSV